MSDVLAQIEQHAHAWYEQRLSAERLDTVEWSAHEWLYFLRSMPQRLPAERLAELDPAQPVVCICHHGARSAQVVAFLERQGFAAVYNLAGGVDAWSGEVDPAVPRY